MGRLRHRAWPVRQVFERQFVFIPEKVERAVQVLMRDDFGARRGKVGIYFGNLNC